MVKNLPEVHFTDTRSTPQKVNFSQRVFTDFENGGEPCQIFLPDYIGTMMIKWQFCPRNGNFLTKISEYLDFV